MIQTVQRASDESRAGCKLDAQSAEANPDIWPAKLGRQGLHPKPYNFHLNRNQLKSIAANSNDVQNL
jgi:hypothetical protein